MSEQGRLLSQEVGKILSDRRRELKITQEALAENLRIQRTSISNIESGKQVLHVDVLYDICEELGLTPGNVLDTAWTKLDNEATSYYEEIKKIVEA